MTMTEPTSHSSDTKTENGQLKGFVSAEKDVPTSSPGQEVNKVAYQSGGGSQPCEDGGPLMRNDDSDSSSEEKAFQEAAAKFEKRGVKFHEGIVAGYKDAPDPWKDARGWTWHEVMMAYRLSCEKHNTKPLNRIIQQVQGLVDNGKRQELFSLKGEKLDHKHCESIEEILRRIQFSVIDLEGCHLEDESAVALFDMIEFYDSTCQLNISFNKNIGLRGWQACSKLIRRTPHLIHLDMRNCDLNERSIPIIGRALKLGSTLTVLHLENISLSGRALIILVAALKMNETLMELFLADNKLMPSDGIQLGNLLKYNHKLELLDLRNNHLQDVGTSHLCDGLYEQNLDTGLKTLVLWNNQITYQAMASVAKTLKSAECLETLNLGHNNITNEGMHIVKDGLLKSKALLRLGLQGTKVSCEGAVALAEFVADSPRLVRLDLRENDIKTAGLMALSLAMRVNDTVIRLDLDRDTKKESGMKDYAEQQRRLHQEIMVYCERNQQQTVEREERQKQEKVEHARQEAARQEVVNVVRAAQEALQSNMDYIPSAEKIQRPKLLFSNILAPQRSLESPGDFHEDNIPVTSPPASSQNLSLCLPPTTTPQQLLSTPPADMLLSPQYIPKLTAKKIFSVNRVTESLPSPTLVAGQPSEASSSLNLLTASQVPGAGLPAAISPTTLCQDLATETVKEYIEQIVSEAAVNGARPVPEDKKSKDSEQTDKISSDGQKEESKAVDKDSVCEQNVGGSGDNATEDMQTNEAASAKGGAVCKLEPSQCDKLKEKIKPENVNEGRSVPTQVNSQNAKENCVKPDPSNPSETEQWQTVDTTDLQQSGQSTTTTGETEKPDFHTNLSLNGLARELASALDTVDEQTDKESATNEFSTTDDFEKELDAMLASVGLNLPSQFQLTSEEVATPTDNNSS
ncbi:protein phosphatase 1 regulatory subunit 37-like isoform X1 [Haliotis cracherodii]|uniref:protein phosphatase 1 regulatory subunit 37-like isoform X1 n=1 Tax=Haliotis cracherodii TaxID=6455 RepID=UPI0039E8D3EC